MQKLLQLMQEKSCSCWKVYQTILRLQNCNFPFDRKFGKFSDGVVGNCVVSCLIWRLEFKIILCNNVVHYCLFKYLNYLKTICCLLLLERVWRLNFVSKSNKLMTKRELLCIVKIKSVSIVVNCKIMHFKWTSNYMKLYSSHFLRAYVEFNICNVVKLFWAQMLRKKYKMDAAMRFILKWQFWNVHYC